MITGFLAGAVGSYLLSTVISLPVVPFESQPSVDSFSLIPSKDNPFPAKPVTSPPPVNPVQTILQTIVPVKPTVLRVTRTDKQLDTTKDPIWSVVLVVNGETKAELPALIGRANRQQVNRHVSGSKAPLPSGQYRIDKSGIEIGPFPDPEVGRGYWIPITPLFQTGRSLLGLHQDPSWGSLNGESGTSGCIGVQSVEATKQLVQWIREHNITTLVVES